MEVGKDLGSSESLVDREADFSFKPCNPQWLLSTTLKCICCHMNIQGIP